VTKELVISAFWLVSLFKFGFKLFIVNQEKCHVFAKINISGRNCDFSLVRKLQTVHLKYMFINKSLLSCNILLFALRVFKKGLGC
jgi:hypothetical protein